MGKHHHYTTQIQWTGNKGEGTSDYRAYERRHIIRIAGKKEINCSSDPAFRGDPSLHNPEDLFLSAISACHMLWYLHICAEAGVIVTDYTDDATGTMDENAGHGGHFTEITLHPTVTVTKESMIEKAIELHKKANEFCFMANSVNFPVYHQPKIIVMPQNTEKDKPLSL